MKKIMSVLLALCLVLAMVPVAAGAAEETSAAKTLAEALGENATASGDTVTLSGDVTLSKGIEINGTVTLNLAGYTISASETGWDTSTGNDFLLAVKRNGNLTIEDTAGTGAIKAGEIEQVYAAIKMTVVNDGPAGSPASLTVKGGTLQGYYYGISGNGTRHNTVITVEGGTVEGTHGAGIYHPQEGTLTISGGTITGGETGVELRSGTLTITGGELSTTATEYKEIANSSGTTVSGAALAISQHTTKKDINVSISGGTFTGPYAFSQTNVQSTGETPPNITMAISGGNFTGNVKSANITDFISGGTFIEMDTTTDFETYVVDGMEKNENGEIVIDQENAVAEVNGVGYTDLQKAINDAPDGSTVKLLRDVELDATGKGDTEGALTISGDKSITIDGNNQTIRATSYVVDTATEKGPSLINIQGGVTVTLENITIDGGVTTGNTTTRQAKHGLNINQAEKVTLNNVTIKNNRWYAVMNNGAELVVNGLTTENNQWGINLDKGGTVVINDATIQEDSSIVFEGNTSEAEIKNGSFKHIVVNAGAGIANMTISGGTFNTDNGPTGALTIDKLEGYLAEGFEFSGGKVVEDKPYVPPITPTDPTYTVSVADTENGKVTVSPTSPKEDATVTITATPDEHYKVGTVTVTEKDGTRVTVTAKDGKYTFTQPDSAVTVTVTFVWDNPFTDVGNAWYTNAVEYVHVNGLMAGTSETTFAPNTKLNRAMAVQILYNLEGQPTVTGDTTFTDAADAGGWAVKAITWAEQTGVVAGIGDGLFAPTANVTREQFAQMMYNYADYKGYDLTKTGDLEKFEDASSISSWAETAMSWANGNGLINGHEDTGLIDPAGTATRAQAASIIMNFDLNLVK